MRDDGGAAGTCVANVFDDRDCAGGIGFLSAIGSVELGRDTAASAFLWLQKVADSVHVSIDRPRTWGKSFVWDGVQVDLL